MNDQVREMQRISFAILCDIDDYCTDNGIRYFLSGGTCLGAVRHHGFIPWDDDVDIMLPREDYERFLKGFAEARKDRYAVGSLYTDEVWKRPATRIWDKSTQLRQKTSNEREMGVFIDVFPIDGLPRSGAARWIHYRRLRILNVIRNSVIRTDYFEYEKFRAIKRVLGLITKRMDARELSLRMDNLAKKYDYSSSPKAGAILAIHYWDRETLDHSCFEDAVMFPFEGRMLPIPVGYDAYLTSLYGDYMTIPKEAAEKGYSHLDAWNVQLQRSEQVSGKEESADGK